MKQEFINRTKYLHIQKIRNPPMKLIHTTYFRFNIEKNIENQPTVKRNPVNNRNCSSHFFN